MGITYQIVLYHRLAMLKSPPYPHLDDFTHAVLLLHSLDSVNDGMEAKEMVVEYTAEGIAINRSLHTYLGSNWYVNKDSWFGVVFKEGLFANHVTLEDVRHKAENGTWTASDYRSDNEHNCWAFADWLATWGEEATDLPVNKKKRAAENDDNHHHHHFTKRFATTLLNPNSRPPLPVPKPSGDVVGDCLNQVMTSHKTMHFKEELIGAIFGESNMSAPAIHKLLPCASLSTIKQGLAKAQHHLGRPMSIDTKRVDFKPRVHETSVERDFFMPCMLPFFRDPLSGSKATKDRKTTLRTDSCRLKLWAQYVGIVPKMAALAKDVNIEQGREVYPIPQSSLVPRSFEFFKDHLLSKIRYRQERNVKRCHYCQSFQLAKADDKCKNKPKGMTDAQFVEFRADVEERLRIGQHHVERWHRQSGFIIRLRENCKEGDCLIQCDYYSFYTYQSKINVLGMVIRYMDPTTRKTRIEHMHYCSNDPHDFYFSGIAMPFLCALLCSFLSDDTVCVFLCVAVGFQHAFAPTTDLLVNTNGEPKFTNLVITGDTAMFKGAFLCCLRQIVHDAKYKQVRCVPFCTKHGSNEVDGDGARVKQRAEEMVVADRFNEKKPHLFAAAIVDCCATSNTRAFPLFSLIKAKKREIDAMLPGGNVNNLYPPAAGFGEILLTGTLPHSLLCRRDVNVDEPWRLEKGMGYPLPDLPPGIHAPTWLFVDLASNPNTICQPCSALFLQRIPRDHINCPFSEYTKYSRCGLCGKRTGHTKRYCPLNAGAQVKLADLRSICRVFNISPTGSAAELTKRIAKHQEKDVETSVSVSDLQMFDIAEVEDVSDLSDENEDSFGLA